MNTKKLIKRFLIPSKIITLCYFIKYGAKISHRAEVDFTDNITLGKKCVIGSFSKVKAADGHLRIGDRVGIATGCFVATGAKGINIGDNVIIGPNVNIIGTNYRTDQLDVHLEDLGMVSKGITIGNNVWIGAGTTILDGSVIGDNTIIVANSMVNRRFKPNVILQGNPAKVLMKRCISNESPPTSKKPLVNA